MFVPRKHSLRLSTKYKYMKKKKQSRKVIGGNVAVKRKVNPLSESSGPPDLRLWRSPSAARLWAHAEWEPDWVLPKCPVVLKTETEVWVSGAEWPWWWWWWWRRRTLDDLVVGEVQVEQEKHVEQSQSPTEQQTRSLAHRPGQQNCHLNQRTHISGELRGLRLQASPCAVWRVLPAAATECRTGSGSGCCR